MCVARAQERMYSALPTTDCLLALCLLALQINGDGMFGQVTAALSWALSCCCGMECYRPGKCCCIECYTPIKFWRRNVTLTNKRLMIHEVSAWTNFA